MEKAGKDSEVIRHNKKMQYCELLVFAPFLFIQQVTTHSSATEADIKLIMDELEVTKEEAEELLKKHSGNVRNVLVAFVKNQ